MNQEGEMVGDVLFWAGLVLVGCSVIVIGITVADGIVWRRQHRADEAEQLRRARDRYERQRALEAERMRRLTRHLDEVWADDEDPLAERARDDAIRDMLDEEEDRAIAAYQAWVASLPIANPWTVIGE